MIIFNCQLNIAPFQDMTEKAIFSLRVLRTPLRLFQVLQPSPIPIHKQ